MKPRQRTCRRASGMTTCSAPMPAFGRTACGRNAGRSSMIPSCIAIASELSTHMSRSGRDINGAARDYPTRQSGRANLRRDNQRRRPGTPDPVIGDPQPAIRNPPAIPVRPLCGGTDPPFRSRRWPGRWVPAARPRMPARTAAVPYLHNAGRWTRPRWPFPRTQRNSVGRCQDTLLARGAGLLQVRWAGGGFRHEQN